MQEVLTPRGWEVPGPRDLVSIGGELLCDALDPTLLLDLPSSHHLSLRPCGTHWGCHVLTDHGQQ